MKLVSRISTVAALVFLSIGTAGILILLHGCADIKLLLQPSLWFKDMHTAIPFITLAALIFGAAVMLLWMLYFSRHVVRTLRKSEDFVREILAGSIPGRLSTEGIKDDEIVSFFSTLNFMRDRQVNLAERLRQQRESEENLRQEIEFYDELQLAAFGRLLPEMRRSAGLVKAYTLIELAQARKNKQKEQENNSLASLRRQAGLSRELDFMTDVAKLERKHWSVPQTQRISTIELARELNNRCQLSLKSREIAFVCEYSAGTPEYISSDRELLYQLLYLMIRSAARSLIRGSQVTFSISGNAKNAVFEIKDRGCDPHREALAENYRNCFLNAAGSKPDISGCSLSTIGLELVRTIAAKLGSTFEVESSEETPSLLRMTVPAAATGGDNSHDNLLFMQKSPVLQQSGPETDADAPLHVLLSDDDPEEAEVYSQLFFYDNIILSVYPGVKEMLQGIREEKNVGGIIISAAGGIKEPRKLIAQLRSLTGKNELPILLFTPVYNRELVLELESVSGVWSLVQPLNFAQAAELLRNKKSV